MREKLKKLWLKLKESRKVKVFLVHLVAVLALIGGLYWGESYLTLLQCEFLKMCAALLLGAYCLKPIADWVCRKFL